MKGGINLIQKLEKEKEQLEKRLLDSNVNQNEILEISKNIDELVHQIYLNKV